MSKTYLNSTTQQFLDIYDITNNVIIMKDGSTAVVLTADALNFGLLAEEEQDGIIYAYASLLNSLTYPIQILIKSQTKDVTKYLQLLQDQIEDTTSKLKKGQIGEYKNFIAELIQERNVLDKKFYVVIPSTALEMGIVTPQSVIPGVKTTNVESFERSYILEKARNNLEPKRDHLISQFNRIGLYARQLDTQEIIQLFYTSYNPEAAEGQNLTDSRNYTTPLVKARIQGNIMTDLPQSNQTTQTAQPATTPQLVQQAQPQVQPINPTPTPTMASPLTDIPITPPQPTTPALTQTPPTTPQATQTSSQTTSPNEERSTAPTQAQIEIGAANKPTPEEVVAATTATPVPIAQNPDSILTVPEGSANVEDVQSAIDTTIQQLGTTPTKPATNPNITIPQPSAPSINLQAISPVPTTVAPPTQPIMSEIPITITPPPTTPESTPPPTPSNQAGGDTLPPLPEI